MFESRDSLMSQLPWHTPAGFIVNRENGISPVSGLISEEGRQTFYKPLNTELQVIGPNWVPLRVQLGVKQQSCGLKLWLHYQVLRYNLSFAYHLLNVIVEAITYQPATEITEFTYQSDNKLSADFLYESKNKNGQLDLHLIAH